MVSLQQRGVDRDERGLRHGKRDAAIHRGGKSERGCGPLRQHNGHDFRWLSHAYRDGDGVRGGYSHS